MYIYTVVNQAGLRGLLQRTITPRPRRDYWSSPAAASSALPRPTCSSSAARPPAGCRIKRAAAANLLVERRAAPLVVGSKGIQNPLRSSVAVAPLIVAPGLKMCLFSNSWLHRPSAGVKQSLPKQRSLSRRGLAAEPRGGAARGPRSSWEPPRRPKPPTRACAHRAHLTRRSSVCDSPYNVNLDGYHMTRAVWFALYLCTGCFLVLVIAGLLGYLQ
jgi:hypothetical protein